MTLKKPSRCTYEGLGKGMAADSERVHTACRSCSASFCFPPGSSNLDRSIFSRSAQSKAWLVFLGRCHLGRGTVCGIAEGMVTTCQKIVRTREQEVVSHLESLLSIEQSVNAGNLQSDVISMLCDPKGLEK